MKRLHYNDIAYSIKNKVHYFTLLATWEVSIFNTLKIPKPNFSSVPHFETV